MAIISGLLELQAYNTTDERIQKLLKDSMMRIKSMALIHESFYQSDQASYVVFERYLKAFVDHIKTVLETPDRKLTINLQSNPVKLNINQAIPLGLLINEFIINAYVHAFGEQKKGTIDISISENDKLVILKVKDNGQGLPSDFNLESPTTLGTTIIKTLTMQLKGDLSFESEEETEFSISFKKEGKRGSSSSMSTEHFT